MPRRRSTAAEDAMGQTLSLLAPERHRLLLIWIGRGVQTPGPLCERLEEPVERTARTLARLIEEGILEYNERRCSLAHHVTLREDEASVELAVRLPGGSWIAITTPKHLI